MEKKIYSPESLGHILRGERKIRGQNQKNLGKLVGLDQTTISAIERGNAGTRLDTLFRLLAALELELVIRPRKKDSYGAKGDLW